MATRERSPNYPFVALPTAVDLLKRLYDADKRTAVSPEAAVQAWGHGSPADKRMSGPARSRLAALRQYGLIEPVAGKKVRVSDLGLTLALSSPDHPDYSTALKQAAL